MSRAPSDPLAGTSCEITHPWESRADRSPYENLRALMRALSGDPAPSEISAMAYRYIPGLGDTDTDIVELVYEEFAEEHALARADRWMSAQDELPTISIPEGHSRPEDAGNVVADEIVRKTVRARLSRISRACPDDGSDIVCGGPDDTGIVCPTCSQQHRRDDAIIDALLDAYEERAVAGKESGRIGAFAVDGGDK